MIEDGIHQGIRPADYHAWEFDIEQPEKGPISNSLLKRFAKSPTEFKEGNAPRPSIALNWGSLVDCLLFTPEQIGGEFRFKSENPHLSKNGAILSKDAKEWQAENSAGGVRWITEEELSRAEDAVENLGSEPASGEILEGALFQAALVHTPDHGIPVKALLDAVPFHPDHADSLVDLKTTSANIYNDSDLARQIAKWKYHVQAALYLHIYNKIADDYRNRWQIIWQRSVRPFEIRVTELDEDYLSRGRKFIRCYLPRFVRALQSNRFQSPFRYKSNYLAMHPSAFYAEEEEMDLLTSLER